MSAAHSIFIQSTRLPFLLASLSFSSSLETMIPHLDLLLLACLHASVISCILLVTTLFLLICLLLASFLTLFSIILFDAFNIISPLSSIIDTLIVNLELGFTLILFLLMSQVVGAALLLMPLFKSAGSTVKVRVRCVFDYFQGF